MARINRSGMSQLHSLIRAEVVDVADDIEAEIKRRQPNDTGRTRSQWRQRVTRSTDREITITISNPSDVAAWLHTGTGIYGPVGRPITPVTADFLRFRPKGASQFIFRRSVRGMPPSDYIIDGMEAASPWPVTVHSRPGQAIPRGR